MSMITIPVTEGEFPMLYNVFLREGIQTECPGAYYDKETKTTKKCDKRVWINRVKKEGPNMNKLFMSCFKDKDGCGYFATIESSDAQGKPLTIKEGKWNSGNRKHCGTTQIPTESILSLIATQEKMSPERIAEQCSKFILDQLGSDENKSEKVEEIVSGVKRKLDENVFTDIPSAAYHIDKKQKVEEEESNMEKTD
jgi:hypothetical protein